MATKKNDSATIISIEHSSEMDALVDRVIEYWRKSKAHVAAMKRENSRKISSVKKRNDAQHKRMETTSHTAARAYEPQVANRRKQGDSPSTASKRSKAKVRARKNAMGQKNPRWGTKNV